MKRRQAVSRYVGLLGWPVEHSLSPAMHNAAFRALALPWEYVLLPTRPLDLGRAVERLKGGEWGGANVTVPHKESIISHLDDLSPEAETIGAVNTIVVRDGNCFGHNTDVTGFLRVLGDRDFEPRDKRTLVLGAGGAARAVVYALLQAGAEVVICNRTLERAEALALSFASVPAASVPTARPPTNSVLEEEMERCQLLVNATSVGMTPNEGVSPWPEDIRLRPRLVVCDLVYAPLETQLLQRARAEGAEVIDGLQMLVCQGVEAFRLWTGVSPPREVMYQAAAAAVPVDEQVEERCSVS